MLDDNESRKLNSQNIPAVVVVKVEHDGPDLWEVYLQSLGWDVT